MSDAIRVRVLVAILRLGGCLTGSAFLAVLLPTAWMAGIHAWLGMGDLPQAPIVVYLARAAAALYGFHGVMLFIIAADPVRHRPLVRYVAAMNIVFGASLVVIDWRAGLPLWWTLGEGPPLVVVGLLVAWLSRSLPDAR